MIRVIKPPTPPQKLETGAARTEQDGIAYSNGKKHFDFDRTIYGHPIVKHALSVAQHQKCCFCEGRFGAYAPADVEHYRPKGATRQDENSPTVVPGYFWLAYSWDNLYYCCQVCNRNNKKNFFPLTNPDMRVRAPNGDLNDEHPLILDPGGRKDPREHIKFRYEHVVGKTDAGRQTIRFLGLNRASLIEERLKHLRRLRAFSDVLRLSRDSTDPEDIQAQRRAVQELTAAVCSASEFSAMAADFLRETASPTQSTLGGCRI